MKTVIEMARDAKLSPVDFPTTEQLEAFAELVRADEREACAKVCEQWAVGVHIADDIRARGATHDRLALPTISIAQSQGQ